MTMQNLYEIISMNRNRNINDTLNEGLLESEFAIFVIDDGDDNNSHLYVTQ